MDMKHKGENQDASECRVEENPSLGVYSTSPRWRFESWRKASYTLLRAETRVILSLPDLLFLGYQNHDEY